MLPLYNHGAKKNSKSPGGLVLNSVVKRYRNFLLTPFRLLCPMPPLSEFPERPPPAGEPPSRLVDEDPPSEVPNGPPMLPRRSLGAHLINEDPPPEAPSGPRRSPDLSFAWCSPIFFPMAGAPTSCSPPSVLRRHVGACSVPSCSVLPRLLPLRRGRAMAEPQPRGLFFLVAASHRQPFPKG